MVRPHSLPPPYGPGTRVLDEFVVETEVARTPVWDVYTASSESRSEAIVVRILRRLELPAGALDALVARATALVSLAHPSLAPVIAAGTHQGRLAIASVDVPGHPLRGLLASADSHRLAARDTGRVVREIAEALQYLHEQRPQLIHGALRPAKIVLRGPERRATLIEWGLEQIVWEAAKAASLEHVTDPSVIASYQAPEAEELGSPVGPAADQFVLASVAYECLVGARAFPGDAQALRAIRSTQRPWVASARSDLPDELDAVLHRAWFVDPAARYPDVISFARAFTPLVASADETGRTAPLQLESIPAPRVEPLELPAALAHVAVPAIDEADEDLEIEDDAPNPSETESTEVPHAAAAPLVLPHPPATPVFTSRKATLLAVQPPPPAPPVKSAVEPVASAAPVKPAEPPSSTSANAAPAATSAPMSPTATAAVTATTVSPTTPTCRAAEIALASPAASLPVAKEAVAKPATPAERAPLAASVVAAPPREVPSRGAAVPMHATETSGPEAAPSRRWIPLAAIALVVAGAGAFVLSRRGGDTRVESTPRPPTPSHAANPPRPAEPVAHATEPANPIAPPAHASTPNGAAVDVPRTNVPPANVLPANPSATASNAPSPSAPTATATPSPSDGPLRNEPTHQQIAQIGTDLQAGIDACLAGHRPIGRHVFVGVAFDGPRGALTSVSVRGAAVTAEMSQCIESHARTLHADPVAGRWVQSYHLRLP